MGFLNNALVYVGMYDSLEIYVGQGGAGAADHEMDSGRGSGRTSGPAGEATSIIGIGRPPYGSLVLLRAEGGQEGGTGGTSQGGTGGNGWAGGGGGGGASGGGLGGNGGLGVIANGSTGSTGSTDSSGLGGQGGLARTNNIQNFGAPNGQGGSSSNPLGGTSGGGGGGAYGGDGFFITGRPPVVEVPAHSYPQNTWSVPVYYMNGVDGTGCGGAGGAFAPTDPNQVTGRGGGGFAFVFY
jgi:hypothetical protein